MTSNSLYQKSLTFAEQLTNKADNYIKELNVDKEIEDIKDGMQKHFHNRAFTIDIIVPKSTMAVGSQESAYRSYFCPKGMSGPEYRAMFLTELYKLGFSGDMINLDNMEYATATYYRIGVRW